MPGALLLGLALAQAMSGRPADAAQLARIRKALAEPPAIAASVAAPPRDGLVFRVTVHGRQPDRPVWDNWSSVPSYIRPNMPLYHYEFMQQVTPEAFRGGTFYTMAIPVGSLLELLGRQISIAHRKSQEEHAREEVRKALEEVLACRADPTRPGC